MRVNIEGLINRLDDLQQRLNYLFDKFEKLDDLEQEKMLIEDVKQYFQNEDTFNLSIVIDVLEQVDELDKAFEIIKEKEIDIHLFKISANCNHYNFLIENRKHQLTQKEFDSIREVLLRYEKEN